MIIAVQTLLFFRESIFAVIDRLLRPYYKHFSLPFINNNISDYEESEEYVCAEFDDERGVMFFPPVYAQRYAAVTDCLMDERWNGNLEKVVDFGCHDTSFIKYLKEVPGINTIYGVDIESIPLQFLSDPLASDELAPKRETPLHLILFQGNASDPDYRLIGCDAVVAIEMIEHMLPHDLERLVHTIFGFIKPRVAVITTPNGDFNPLFKNLEKNGLRLLDHFFEWSREQFHDWCSNIVTRYPLYTVSCKGVGPGPPGTQQYGCCSQLALFVSKDYHKQQDLNLNSLALIPNDASCNKVCQFENFDSVDNITENNTIYSPNDFESYTELIFSNKQSCVTVVLSPTFSLEALEYIDKTAQCNLDTEVAKNFLMFDEEQMYNVVLPRRKIHNRVYLIEDVNRRLNCTTLQVKKFSKTAQNILAKNKIDTFVHTKEVLDEIRHLAKMLNLDNSVEKVDGTHTWQNFNWGENAPYWNQYYKVIGEYTYPLQIKTEESLIIDLVSDEINRLEDTQYDEDFAVGVDKFEIPIEHLMKVVQHVTDDVDMVKDLLEWNGYEVVGDVVIHPRLVVDAASPESQDEWRHGDTFSDRNNDVHSTTFSDTPVPDYNGRCLYRALDRKARKLRNMISVDQDLSTLLDRVLCRLMKMALKTASRRQRPLPNRWTQCKLLELLTLTEKAVEKKRRNLVESPLKKICYDQPKHDANIFKNDTANEIVNKYQCIIRSSEKTSDYRDYYIDDLEDDLFNKEILNESAFDESNIDDTIRSPSPSLLEMEPVTVTPMNTSNLFCKENVSSSLRTRAWVDKDINLEKFSNKNGSGILSSEIDHAARSVVRRKNIKKLKNPMNPGIGYRNKIVIKDFNKHMNNDLIRKVSARKAIQKKSNYNTLVKVCSKNMSATSFGTYDVTKSKKSLKFYSSNWSSLSPISNTLLTKCNQDTRINPQSQEIEGCREETKCDYYGDLDTYTDNLHTDIAATEESLLIDIITEDKEETIALLRNIGTDPDIEPTVFKQEAILGSLTNVINVDSFCRKHNIEMENVPSQTIFILDINEPSTSKGVRNVSMHVQCGPDNTFIEYPMLSVTTSFSKVNSIFNTGVLGDSISNNNIADYRVNNDFGTSTEEIFDALKTVTPRMKSVGIKIKDSGTSITDTAKTNNIRHDTETVHTVSPVSKKFDSCTCTTLLKAASSRLKIDDSESEFCDSVTSSQKSRTQYTILSKNTSDSQTKLRKEQNLYHKYCRTKLCCGGVYVHSYKDRQVSEDVVFQGEWQKYSPKTTIKKLRQNKVLPVNYSRLANNKNDVLSKQRMNSSKDNQVNKIKRLPIKNNTLKRVNFKYDIHRNQSIPSSNIVPVTKKCTRSAIKASSQMPADTLKPKNIKVSYLTKKPSITLNVKKDNEKPQKCKKKSYIPLYLKRKIINNDVIDRSPIGDIKKRSLAFPSASDENDTDLFHLKLNPKTVGTDALSFNCKARKNVTYAIFRNEIEVKKNSSTDCDSPLNALNKQSSSSQSLNSSAGSSNSIATVKARTPLKINSDKKHLKTCNKNSLGYGQSESGATKIKKYTKKCKSARKSLDKIFDNKENMPESTTKCRDSERNNKFISEKNKSVYRAHISKDSCPQIAINISKHKSQILNKSNIKIPSIRSSTQKYAVGAVPSRPSVSKEQLSKFSKCTLHSKSVTDTQDSDEVMMSTSNVESVILNPKTKEDVIINIVDNHLLKEWMNSTVNNGAECETSNVINIIRHLIDDRLDFIVQQHDIGHEDGTKTVVLGNEKIDNIPDSRVPSYHDVTSLNTSLSEAIEKHSYDESQIIDIDSILYNECDAVWAKDSIISISYTDPTVTDLEMLSFKSLESISKLSEYFLAESSLNNVSKTISATVSEIQSSSSVRDIFERKTPLQLQGPAGALAAQAFSGFSMNVEPLTGDQHDPANFIDSETGSVAIEFVRQTISEEVFVSGRSSDSYESCMIDDDTVVPNWLFQIISQQQSVAEEDEDPEDLVPMALPVVGPMFDTNGNVVEPGMVVGAGAGDGRGIHSDNSEDSSGRGTSLSSSDTSSGPQSDTILMDSTALTTQYDSIREPLDSSSLLLPFSITAELPDTSRATAAGLDVTQNINVINSSGDPQRIALPHQATSDVDADVSSIDTDVPDSDN